MSVDLSMHDGQAYPVGVTEFDERERSYANTSSYLIFSVRQNTEEFRYFMHFSRGLSPDYVREVASHFSNFGALLLEKADNLPASDEEE